MFFLLPLACPFHADDWHRKQSRIIRKSLEWVYGSLTEACRVMKMSRAEAVRFRQGLRGKKLLQFAPLTRVRNKKFWAKYSQLFKKEFHDKKES